MKAIIFLFFILATAVDTDAQSGYLDGKLPLDSGNVWVYYRHSSGFDPYDFRNETITIDTIQYRIINHRNTGTPMYLRLRKDDYYVQRLDSSSINDPNDEQIFYKKNAVIGDSWTNIFDTTIYTSVVTDTFPAYVFDTLLVGKNVYINAYLNIFNQVWSEEFGLLYVEDFYGPLCYLAGCVINGRLYGDTSITSVEYEPLLIFPEKIELLQNYPNPYNSVTKIRYSIPELCFVTIKVYDILGNKIKTLVSEVKPTGSYEIEFDAAGLPSGIYFYTLTSGGFTASKKLMLLK